MQYGAYLQKQLETFLSSVDGVGRVKVCLTMQTSKELVPAHNTPYTRKSEEETDENGKRTLTETQNDAQIILYEQADRADGKRRCCRGAGGGKPEGTK